MTVMRGETFGYQCSGQAKRKKAHERRRKKPEGKKEMTEIGAPHENDLLPANLHLCHLPFAIHYRRRGWQSFEARHRICTELLHAASKRYAPPLHRIHPESLRLKMGGKKNAIRRPQTVKIVQHYRQAPVESAGLLPPYRQATFALNSNAC